MASWIYFIKPVVQPGPVKIGSARDPEARLKQLRGASPVALEIVAAMRGSVTVERRLHALFIADHDHCEWFSWSEKLQDTIDAVVDGSFDASVLPAPYVVSRGAKGRVIGDYDRLKTTIYHRVHRLHRRDVVVPDWIWASLTAYRRYNQYADQVSWDAEVLAPVQNFLAGHGFSPLAMPEAA